MFSEMIVPTSRRSSITPAISFTITYIICTAYTDYNEMPLLTLEKLSSYVLEINYITSPKIVKEVPRGSILSILLTPSI